MSKAILLGLDGATFSLLDPLLQAGRLPHFARLARRGVRGPLRSTVHPLTPAAWTTAVTGLNPGKHGIYDFRRRRPGSYALELVNARSRNGQPFWDALGALGKQVGIFNVPMTYPPQPVNGFMVSGMDAPGVAGNFVYPAALRADLLADVPDYQIDVDAATTDEDELLDRIERLAAVQQRALETLLRRFPDCDVLMAVFVATDRLYHTFWRYLDPAHADSRDAAQRARAVHERIWQGLDDCLGMLWQWAGDDATIIVLSDHGFGPLEKDVYMNRFLLDAGLLHLRDAAPAGNLAQAADWQRTRAYSFGFFGNVNLNLRGREPQGCVEQGREAEDLKRVITQSLHELRDPQSGERIVDSVYRREELYSGPHLDGAPDLLVIMRDYAYMTRDGYEGMMERLLASPMSRDNGRLAHSGNHRLDGVLMMAGPGVRPGGEVTGATLMDIAPTLFYVLGLPVPGYMDGRVLQQAFSEEHRRNHPGRRVLSAPPPLEDAAQQQMATLARRVDELEATVARLEATGRSSAAYAGELESAIAAKNAHIAQLEVSLRHGEVTMSAYQRSLFFRAYQRWQRITRRGPP